MFTPRMTARRKARNWALACGSLPGSRRFSPSSVLIDQLLCLPEPLIPANGFSWIRNMSAVARREPAHRAHDDHVVVRPDGRRLEHRGHLELAGRDLVVARPGRDPEPPQLAVEIHHEREDSLPDRAEVLILELLALRRRGSEQGPPGQDEVRALLREPAIDEEVLLLGPDRRVDPVRGRVPEPAKHPERLPAEGLLRSKQRDLVVERLAGERDVGRRDGQGDAVRLDLEEDRAGDVPGGVAAGLEGRPDAARWERARVGLALDQESPGELGDRVPVRATASGTSRASPRSSRSSARTSG